MNILKKIKNNKAISIADVAIGLIVLMMFTGILTSSVYEIYKHNALTKIDAIVTNYMVKVAEEIDLLPYDQINENLSQTINEKCNIPEEFNINFTIQDYKLEESQEDIIKYVTINIEYKALEKDENYSVKKIKIKEI